MNEDIKVDIFSEATPESGEFKKFAEIGDSVQGTYIGKNESIDSFQNEQFIYLIKDVTGKIWNVAFRKSNQVVNERMNGINLGQIVGFRYDEERPGKMGNKAKIIRIYADPKHVDSEWLRSKAEIDSFSKVVRPEAPVRNEAPTQPTEPAEEEISTEDIFSVPEDAKAVKSGVVNTSEKGNMPLTDVEMTETVKAIITLAENRGLIKKGLSPEDAYTAIEEYTNLPLVEENMTDTIVALTKFVK